MPVASKDRLKDIFRTAVKRAVRLTVAFSLVIGGGAAANEGAGVDPQKEIKVSAQKEKQTHSFDYNLFETNFMESLGSGTVPLKLGQMTERQRLEFYMESFCFKPKDKTVLSLQFNEDQRFKMDIAAFKLLGKPLAETAAGLNVSYCGLPRLAAGTGGQYLPSVTAVILPVGSEGNMLPLVFAHEIMHAAQDKNGGMNYFYDWDISSRVMRTLSTEAASKTVEFMVAFEAKLDGNPKIWDYLNSYVRNPSGLIFSDKQVYSLMEEEYKAATESGLSRDDALRAVAFTLWHNIFENAEWRDFYLDLSLKLYIRNIAEGNLKEETLKHGQYGQKDIDRAGLIGSGPSFTLGAKPPPFSSLIEKNPKMKWVFEAAEIARLERVWVKDDPRLATMREKSRAEGNPYLDLDIEDIHARIAASTIVSKGKFLQACQIMDDMLAERAPKADLPVTPPPPPPSPSPPSAGV